MAASFLDSISSNLVIPESGLETDGAENLVTLPPNKTKQATEKLFTKCGLKVMHINIHYLFPKFDEIKILLGQNPDIDILCLCETFLNDSFSDSEFQLQGYQLFRKDRKTNGGGIAMYIKDSLTCLQRHELESDNVESVWLEIQQSKQKSFILGYVY